jgi:hypothetical protein
VVQTPEPREHPGAHDAPPGEHRPRLEETPHPDLLAAVVLHALLSAPGALTLAEATAACERDPADQADRAAIAEALQGLIADGLAHRRGGRFGATRAALRADALRF